MTTHFSVPGRLDLPTALAFAKTMSQSNLDDEYVYDFRLTRYVEPFSMLFVSCEIRRLMHRFPDARFTCRNFQHMTYAGHMGFFRAFGLDFGKAPGEAKGSPRYIPLTLFHCETLEKAAAQKGIEVGEEVEGQSRRIAAILCGNDQCPVFETLSYSVRELMRNVVEHSKAVQFGVCAQLWPTQNKVEFSILDTGIGLRESLSRNPHITPTDDKRAINYALMPAVSGKAFKGAKTRQSGPWANSGFGLYMTSRICRNGGSFFVATGMHGMLLTTRAEAKRYFECDLSGTAVRMVIKTDKIGDLRNSLERFRNEGYEIQKKYREIVSIDPSSASLMLSEDFDLSVWDRILSKLKGAI